MLHRFVFTIALTIASRIVQLRDQLMGRVPRGKPECTTVSAEQQTIESGRNVLDAMYVEPRAGAPVVSVLICHGIGEVVAQWFPIQRMLAEQGIASLVFDYSGYGRSTGRIDWMQCEDDAVCAFERLRELAPKVPIALLGFSLGTGVAPAVLNRVCAERLVLCAGYSSFRRAARAALIPPVLSFLVPPIWSAQEALRGCNLPILVVQGDCDRLFEMKMAQELVDCCAGRANLMVLPARSHNEPFYYPSQHYWGPIVQWLLEQKPVREASADEIAELA